MTQVVESEGAILIVDVNLSEEPGAAGVGSCLRVRGIASHPWPFAPDGGNLRLLKKIGGAVAVARGVLASQLQLYRADITMVIPKLVERVMSATTLKISDQLRRRIALAAKAADKSPHAFMLEAIEQQTRLDEQRRAFVGVAVTARREALASGEGYAAGDVRQYVTALVNGRKAARPKAVTWRK